MKILNSENKVVLDVTEISNLIDCQFNQISLYKNRCSKKVFFLKAKITKERLVLKKPKN